MRESYACVLDTCNEHTLTILASYMQQVDLD